VCGNQFGFTLPALKCLFAYCAYMRVLVTGSSGKLGRVTVKLLADFGHLVTGLDISGSATTNLIADVKDKYRIFKSEFRLLKEHIRAVSQKS
jgi:nucleoside-diphosphate-sugar epimerase